MGPQPYRASRSASMPGVVLAGELEHALPTRRSRVTAIPVRRLDWQVPADRAGRDRETFR